MLWRNNYSKEDFVAYIEAFQVPNASGCSSGSGILTNQQGWDTFFKSCAGDWFDIATENGIDPLVIMSWSLNESGWGTSKLSYEKANLWGYGANDEYKGNDEKYGIDFSNGIKPNPEGAMQGLRDLCEHLKETYLTPGGTYYNKAVAAGKEPTSIEGVCQSYCNGRESWTNSCTSMMKNVFGDFISQHCSGGSGDIIQSCENIIQLILPRNAHYSLSFGSTGLTGGDIEKVYNSDDRLCCATYVALVLYDSGLLSAEQINKYGYNGVYGISDMLRDAGWTQVNVSEAQAGDIALWLGTGENGHAYIYGGGDLVYDQKCCVTSSGGTPPTVRPGTNWNSYYVASGRVDELWRAP